MIRITKPLQPPAILRVAGTRKRVALCREFTLNEMDFRQGLRTFTFDGGVYGHATVKQALVDAQYGKCCFCERKVGADGDVEHFRPKAGVRQNVSSPMLRPGYYWLAYDWDNLLLSCSACNQRHKRNLFPIATPADRAASHNDSVDDEDPLFIHPAHVDPQQYISFRKEIPYSLRGNRFAKQTIAALGLDREILNEVRRDRLGHLAAMRNVLDCRHQLSGDMEGQRLLRQAEKYLQDAVLDNAEFAGMARAAARLDFRVSLP